MDLRKYFFAAIFISVGVNVNAYASPDPVSGKTIFTARCASCHSIQKDMTGPALMNVTSRHEEEWIIRFVHGSQSVIRSGDTSATRLFQRFNQTVMPDHPDLSDDDIRNILAYISNESERVAALPKVPAVPADHKPYAGRSSAFHQLVYLDIPGDHVPVNLGNPYLAVSLTALVVVLVLGLLVVVKTRDLMAEREEPRGGTGLY